MTQACNAAFGYAHPLTLWAFSLALLVVAVGCGEDDGLAPVSGVVLMDGKPLTGFDNAAVVFTPESGRLATSVIDSQGRFRLETIGKGDGASIGPAKVIVTATVDGPTNSNPDSRYGGIRSVIPKLFGDPDASGMECVVAAGELNTFEIHLSSDGKASIEKQ